MAISGHSSRYLCSSSLAVTSDPLRDFLNAGEEALFTVELNRFALRLGNSCGVEARKLRPPHHHDSSPAWLRKPDADVGADQKAAGVRRGVFLLRLAQ